MSSPGVPTSILVRRAQAQRERRRRGLRRARILAAVFGASFLLGLIGGLTTPGA